MKTLIIATISLLPNKEHGREKNHSKTSNKSRFVTKCVPQKEGSLALS